MKVISVVGARPQFVKLAPIAHAMTTAGVEHTIVHTGQHYDYEMSESFFADLQIDPPEVNLSVGSGTHGQQTGQMLTAIEEFLLSIDSDWVLVYGDTNSTIAGALAAVKLHRRVAHLEAGLRSFNRRMPEEINRVATDHLSDLLLAPTDIAAGNLAREGLSAKTVVTGDIMADLCLATARTVVDQVPDLPPGVDPGEPYVVATIHRAENTDDTARLEAILDGLASLTQPVVLAAHPRLVHRAKAASLDINRFGLRVAKPMSYPAMIGAVSRAAAVITDSGGLQKEAYLLGVPCTTVRPETEWVETLDNDWNVLAEPSEIGEVTRRARPTAVRLPYFGDGNAARAVVDALESARHGHLTSCRSPTG